MMYPYPAVWKVLMQEMTGDCRQQCSQWPAYQRQEAIFTRLVNEGGLEQDDQDALNEAVLAMEQLVMEMAYLLGLTHSTGVLQSISQGEAMALYRAAFPEGKDGIVKEEIIVYQ